MVWFRDYFLLAELNINGSLLMAHGSRLTGREIESDRDERDGSTPAVSRRQVPTVRGRVVQGSLFLDPTRPDPTRDCRQNIWPDPTLLPIYMFHEFKILVASNSTQLLHGFEGNSGKYFSPGFVKFPAWGWKNLSRIVLFSRPWSRCKKTANIRC